MMSLIQICRYRVALVCFIILLTASVKAEMCDLEDSDFPSADCSFNLLGTNIQMLKFGQVDSLFNSDENLRIGNAVYVAGGNVTVHDTNDSPCDTFTDDDFDDVNLNDEVAFLPSTTNPREITDIWILNCEVVQDR